MLRALLSVVTLFVTACAAQYPLGCRYPADDGELVLHADCAVRQGARITISKDQLAQMSFGTEGLASAFIEGSWHYINATGEALPVITYDNGPDYFSEGLVRSLVEGKIAYFNARFEEVIRPTYDWGWPFDGGRALVCSGCKKGQPDEYGHTPIVGGVWGYIDKRGTEVVPVKLSASEARAK